MLLGRHDFDYRHVVDRGAQVRAVRRREALDALAFERDRAAMLTEQLEETVAGVEGAQVDAALYAQLNADDVSLVRAALRDGPYMDDDEVDPESSTVEGDDVDLESADDSADEGEEEIARLQSEIEHSARVQAALERYLDLLRDR